MLDRTDTFLLKSSFPSPTAPTWNPTSPGHVEEGRDLTIKNSSLLKNRHMEKDFSFSRMIQHVLLKRQSKIRVPLPPLTRQWCTTVQEATKLHGDRIRGTGINEMLVPGDQDMKSFSSHRHLQDWSCISHQEMQEQSCIYPKKTCNPTGS